MLLDDLGSLTERMLGDGEAEHLSSSEIDHQLEAHRLDNWQGRWPGALEEPAQVARGRHSDPGRVGRIGE